MFLKEFPHLFNQNTVKTVIVYYFLQCTVFYLNIFWNAEFPASFLQSSVSYDPLEIILIWWLAAQETFFFSQPHTCGNRDAFFSGFFDEQNVQINAVLLK